MNKPQVREFILELFRFHDKEDLIESFKSWQMPYFPIKGEHLKDKGVKGEYLFFPRVILSCTLLKLWFFLFVGQGMGIILNKMKELWVDSDFQYSESDIMNKLPEILSELPEIMNEKNQRKSKKIKTSSWGVLALKYM